MASRTCAHEKIWADSHPRVSPFGYLCSRKTQKIPNHGQKYTFSRTARSTLSDANARRPHEIFGKIYQGFYLAYKDKLSSDSCSGKVPKWMKKLQIIDSTTISLLSNLVFKGVGRNPRKGKKKGGMKVHTCIHGNEGVPCDVEFTSAATHDHFMLCPGKLNRGDILAIDRASTRLSKNVSSCAPSTPSA